LEILALRQQLAMLARKDRKLRLRRRERLFWIRLYRIWPGSLETLAVFKADTLVRWHRPGFRLFWTWKSSRRRGGRPSIFPEIRALIRRLSRENPLWGAPRVHGELKMLGINVSQATVADHMVRHRTPPSQTWRTFLDNHAKSNRPSAERWLPSLTSAVFITRVGALPEAQAQHCERSGPVGCSRPLDVALEAPRRPRSVRIESFPPAMSTATASEYAPNLFNRNSRLSPHSAADPGLSFW
jgi:hypothetical protein